MGQALYRKYRSKSLAEIVGQPHITSTLRTALERGQVSHAYLFTGPRGTGKTSIARILAHEVNNLTYSEDPHLDIIEIDAASNRRIDEIRELRERVHTAPTSAKYKVYIIDEVHMLTKEAFNALLKTLEEPPQHVIFVLATTESHKLPDTIISRTQRHSFKPVSQKEVVAHLRMIANKESITINDDALSIIAHHGDGSFRDSISLLDQVKTYADSIDETHVHSVLGLASDDAITKLLEALTSGSPSTVVSLLQDFKTHGYQPAMIAGQLATTLRNDLIRGSLTIDSSLVPALLAALIAVPASHDPEASLELALLTVVLQTYTPTAAKQNIKQPERTPKTTQPIPEEVAQETKQKVADPKPEPEVAQEEPQIEAQDTAPTAQGIGESLSAETWMLALADIKKSHNTLYSIARMATPAIDDNIITLQFKFGFHQKRIDETKNKQVLSDIIEKIHGSPITLKTATNAKVKSAPTEPIETAAETKPNTTISTISNIFGSAEVLD